MHYTDSAYVHVGGLDYELTEGDVIVIFSQCVKTLSNVNSLDVHIQVWRSHGCKYATRQDHRQI